MSRQSIGGTRRHVLLPKVQDDKLMKLSRETGLTYSEHLRRALDSYFRLLDVAKARARSG